MSQLASRRSAFFFAFACFPWLPHCAPKASSESVSSSGTAKGEDAGTPDDDGRDDEAAPDDGEAPPGDGDPWPDDGSAQPGDGSDGAHDAGGPDGDGTTDEGWMSTEDGEPDSNPEPVDGGAPGDCRALAPNTNSGGFGTTESVCFTLPSAPPTAWAVYFGDGRTITINGVEVSPGHMPFPGAAPYTVRFSAGSLDYTAWAYW